LSKVFVAIKTATDRKHPLLFINRREVMRAARPVSLAIAGIFACALSLSQAQAATMQYYYTVTTSSVVGNAPTIGYTLPKDSSGSPGSLNLTPLNTPLFPQAPVTTQPGLGSTDFLSLSPTGSCNWQGCPSQASETLDVQFTFKDASGNTATLTQYGDYSAKYSGTYLGCSGKTGSGQSDCIDWLTTSTDYHSSTASSVTDWVSFGDGTTLAVTFYNYQDWTLYPDISFDLDPTGATPLPAALPLFASGLGAMGLLGWRRKRKSAAAIAAA